MFTKQSVRNVKRGLQRMPAHVSHHILKAQEVNAKEANAYMSVLVPHDTGTTSLHTGAFAFERPSDGSIVMQMYTERPVLPGEDAEDYVGQTIRKILFDNGQDFFYGTWRLNRKRWKGRLKRGVTKAAKEFVNV